MKNLIRKFLGSFALCLGLVGAAQAACVGKPFLPTDLDPSFAGPIRIGASPSFPIGVSPAFLPVQQYAVPPFMICPLFRPCVVIQMGGVPREIIETTSHAGCSTNLGTSFLSSVFGMMDGEGNSGGGSNSARRIHTHTFKWDGGAIDFLTGLGCRQVSGFELVSISEIDFCNNSDACSAIMSPYYLPFSVPPISLAGIPDHLIAEIDTYGSDLIYGCYGDKGCQGMLSTNIAVSDSDYTSQHAAAARTVARNYATLTEMQTTGPSTVCFSHPNPIMVKSENRFQNCGTGLEGCSYGRPQSVSGSGFFQFPPPNMTRGPGFESGYFIKWKGINCCLGVGLG